MPFDSVLYTDNVHDKVNILNNLLISLIELHAPTQTVRISKSKGPWLTDNLKSIMKLRDKAFNKYKNLKFYKIGCYKNLRNYTNSAIDAEKKAFLRHQIETNNTKYLWKKLENLSMYKGKNRIDIPAELNNANDINKYFTTSNIINNPDPSLLNHYATVFKVTIASFELVLINNEEITKTINSIKSTATSPDGLNIIIILYCCHFIINYITNIIHSCILQNIFPSQWKISRIISILKKDTPQELKDLHPISVFGVLSKIFEKVINTQLRDYMYQFKI